MTTGVPRVLRLGVLPPPRQVCAGAAERTVHVPRSAMAAPGLLERVLGRLDAGELVAVVGLQWVPEPDVDAVLTDPRVVEVHLAVGLDDRALEGRATGAGLVADWSRAELQHHGGDTAPRVSEHDLAVLCQLAGGTARVAALHLVGPLVGRITAAPLEPTDGGWVVPPAVGQWALQRCEIPRADLWTLAAELADNERGRAMALFAAASAAGTPTDRSDGLAAAAAAAGRALAAAEPGAAPCDPLTTLQLRWIAAAGEPGTEREVRTALVREALDLDETLAGQWIDSLRAEPHAAGTAESAERGDERLDLYRAELARRDDDPATDELLSDLRSSAAGRLRALRSAWPGLSADPPPSTPAATAVARLREAGEASEVDLVGPGPLDPARREAARRLAEVLDAWRRGVPATAADLAAQGDARQVVPSLRDALRALATADLGRGREGRDAMAEPEARGRASAGELALAVWARAECEWAAGRPAAARACAATLPAEAVGTSIGDRVTLVDAWAAFDLRNAIERSGRDGADGTDGSDGADGAGGGEPAVTDIPWVLDAAREEAAGLAAMTEDPGRAAEHFARAAELWGDERRSALRCDAVRGEALRRAGRTDDAVALLRTTFARAEELGLATVAARTRRSLRRAGVAMRRGGRGDGELTTREEEVMLAVAAGSTSPEIAVLLGVSQSTVETQIASAMAKLGARSRVQAAAQVAAGATRDRQEMAS